MWLSFALACTGIFALVLHGFLLLQGGAEFRTAISIAVLAGTGLVSAAQLAVVLHASQRSAASAGESPAPSRS
jgi:hypothetical protein